MLTQLAALTDLQDREIDTTDATRANTALDAAAAAVREAAGCPINLATSTIKLPGVDDVILTLPGGPVQSVGAVLMDGVAVSDFDLVPPNELWRPTGWLAIQSPIWFALRPRPTIVTVTYTHGLTTTPADIVDLVCNLAAASMSVKPGERVGIISERIDDYQVAYGPLSTVMDIPEELRAQLRARFGGAVDVVDMR